MCGESGGKERKVKEFNRRNSLCCVNGGANLVGGFFGGLIG